MGKTEAVPGEGVRLGVWARLRQVQGECVRLGVWCVGKTEAGPGLFPNPGICPSDR